MSQKSWSLQARLVRWASVGSVVLACALAVGAIWFVWSELHRELDLLAHEEVEELEANVRGRTFTLSELEQLLSKIAFDLEYLATCGRRSTHNPRRDSSGFASDER